MLFLFNGFKLTVALRAVRETQITVFTSGYLQVINRLSDYEFTKAPLFQLKYYSASNKADKWP
jgi:hypothetical protein